MKLTLKAASATHRVLLYGGPKTGKTELAGKLAQYYNLIWFDVENGYVTLTKLPQEYQERIELITVPDSRVYPIAIETLMKVVKGTEVFICEEHGKVACPLCKKDSKPQTRVCLNETRPDTVVVFDSLTQFTNSAIAHITKNQPDDYKLQLDDWGALRVLMDKFLSQIQVAPYNVVCITHEEEVVLEDGKKRLVPVCGSSTSSRNTAKYFDHVVYCQLMNKKHVYGSSTGYGINMITGSRTDVAMENRKDEATLLDIFTSWKGGFSSAKPSVSINEVSNTETKVDAPAVVESVPTPAPSLTPAQQALANLKAKGLVKS